MKCELVTLILRRTAKNAHQLSAASKYQSTDSGSSMIGDSGRQRPDAARCCRSCASEMLCTLIIDATLKSKCKEDKLTPHQRPYDTRCCRSCASVIFRSEL